MASENIKTITKDNFEQEVLNSQVPVLVDFWAAWCGPCRAVAPIMEQLAVEYAGKASVAKVDVDQEGELAAKFRVLSIPTVMLFKGGQVVEKIIGARSKEEFSGLIKKNL
ncbi:MAG: thioredoxin [Clostridiales bacterium GWC2_40_7]|nr:MAG: thioredoxin [Clostridiales bacterium GWC2_40_7]